MSVSVEIQHSHKQPGMAVPITPMLSEQRQEHHSGCPSWLALCSEKKPLPQGNKVECEKRTADSSLWPSRACTHGHIPAQRCMQTLHTYTNYYDSKPLYNTLGIARTFPYACAMHFTNTHLVMVFHGSLQIPFPSDMPDH